MPGATGVEDIGADAAILAIAAANLAFFVGCDIGDFLILVIIIYWVAAQPEPVPYLLPKDLCDRF